MKNVETKNYTSNQKQVTIGDRVRSVIVIDRKSKDVSGKVKKVSYKTATIKKRCSGCSRKRKV